MTSKDVVFLVLLATFSSLIGLVFYGAVMLLGVFGSILAGVLLIAAACWGLSQVFRIRY